LIYGIQQRPINSLSALIPVKQAHITGTISRVGRRIHEVTRLFCSVLQTGGTQLLHYLPLSVPHGLLRPAKKFQKCGKENTSTSK
jgi:hypothetical protein